MPFDLPEWSPVLLTIVVGVFAVLVAATIGVARGGRSRARLQTDLALAQQQQLADQARIDELNDENQYLKDQLAEQERELIRAQSTYEAQQQAAKKLYEQLQQNQAEMRGQFQQLAQSVLQQQTQHIQQTGQQGLQQLLEPLKTQLQDFQQRINQVHSESVRGQTELGAELRRVLEIGLQMSTEAQQLSQALKGDKKRMGTWGEMLLAQTLEQMGLIKGQHFLAQPRYRDQQGQLYIPDFVVHLPNNKHLVLDSKTSLVDYERALAAEQHEDYEQSLNDLSNAFERHIDDLAKKNYRALPQLNSPDFVLMFVPLEPAYLAALSHRPALFEYGLRKNIILTSHTSLVPILRTIAQIWSLADSHEHAHALAQQATAIFTQLDRLSQRLKRVGDSIGHLANHYNNSVTALVGQQGLYAKLERFQQLSQHRLPDTPEVQPLFPEVQKQRLQPYLAAAEPAEADSDDSSVPSDADSDDSSNSSKPDAL